MNIEAKTYAQSPKAAKTVLSSDSRKDARRPFEIAEEILPFRIRSRVFPGFLCVFCFYTESMTKEERRMKGSSTMRRPQGYRFVLLFRIEGGV